MNSESVISFKDVTFGYGQHKVLDEASFEIFSGDYLAVIGPNGGGKTTLLKLLLGLIDPQAGNIEILGMPPGKHGGRIGYMPQYT
ncbi:MAG TPA: metal ABC transporter ATP-binding protein, partial [Desulfovibrio sp.]|nr:metal ABC transporter ATP-binding protein [Desulfovibrio sp.]